MSWYRKIAIVEERADPWLLQPSAGGDYVIRVNTAGVLGKYGSMLHVVNDEMTAGEYLEGTGTCKARPASSY